MLTQEQLEQLKMLVDSFIPPAGEPDPARLEQERNAGREEGKVLGKEEGRSEGKAEGVEEGKVIGRDEEKSRIKSAVAAFIDSL